MRTLSAVDGEEKRVGLLAEERERERERQKERDVGEGDGK